MPSKVFFALFLKWFKKGSFIDFCEEAQNILLCTYEKAKVM